MISNFEVTNLVPCLADDPDLRTNLFEEGGDDMIMESSRKWMQEPEHGDKLVAVGESTFEECWSHKEAIIFRNTLIYTQATFKMIIV